jgi:hypothetical protein
MQPIKPRKPKRADATLAAVRERIRLAEKAQAPIAREMVALDRASFELLASCVEGGLGKKPAVLMQALAIGLQALSGTIGAGAHDNGRGADLPHRRKRDGWRRAVQARARGHCAAVAAPP